MKLEEMESTKKLCGLGTARKISAKQLSVSSHQGIPMNMGRMLLERDPRARPGLDRMIGGRMMAPG